jgi:glycosyltransferase involved in cell wall biosynthesis
MRISVIVPCFNHERFVDECLASVDAQECGDIEVIVVDDGSTDASWERIQAHNWRPGRLVRTVRTPNEGAHAALNRGLAMATGELIAICNSDDSYAPDRLGMMSEALRRGRARFGFSAVTFIDSDGKEATESSYAATLMRKQRAISEFPSVGFALLDSNVTISSGNFVFERSLLNAVGAFRPYRHCHDWDFVLRALLLTEPLYLAKPLYRYRLHPGNSFPLLAAEGEIEGAEILTRFFHESLDGKPPNRLAPSGARWPVYFNLFVSKCGYQRLLPSAESLDALPPARP